MPPSAEIIGPTSRFYFAERLRLHYVDWGNEENPSPGYVAWLLWGGEPGREWAEKTKARLAEEG